MAGEKIQQGQNLIIPQMNVCLLQREYARKQAYKFFMRLSSLTCMLLDWGMYVNACVWRCVCFLTCVCVCRCRYEAVCRLQGCMEIRRYTAAKQVTEEGGGGQGWGSERKEEEESGARGSDNEDSDEREGEPWIEMSQWWREVFFKNGSAREGAKGCRGYEWTGKCETAATSGGLWKYIIDVGGGE